MMTLQEAKHKAANLAIGDLMGWSQPAEGLEDQYPFNADAFARSLPPVMCNKVLEVVAYVYHNERRPPGLAIEGHPTPDNAPYWYDRDEC